MKTVVKDYFQVKEDGKENNRRTEFDRSNNAKISNIVRILGEFDKWPLTFSE